MGTGNSSIHTADRCGSKASERSMGQKAQEDVGQTKHGWGTLPDSANVPSTL
jgi:hypothetical protein